MDGMFGAEVDGFCGHDQVSIDGAAQGPLNGLRFAVKDIIDIEGHVTGCGNPTRYATGAPARRHAAVVQRLLDAGADLAGKTITEEFAYGLIGENYHYGTPVNVNAPGRVPGGSSSGSASVVAAGKVDFALGTDTGGSVRVPAAFCGLYGLRPSHGRVSLDGIMPLAPSLDTCGWFARNPGAMRRVGEVLLDWRDPPQRGRLLVATDAFAQATPDCSTALAPVIDRLGELFGPAEEIAVGTLSGTFGWADWQKAMQVTRGSEAAASHNEWIQANNPAMGPGFRERFEAGARYSAAEIAEAQATRARLSGRLENLLADGAMIAVPAAPGVAPPCRSPEPVYDALRGANETFNSIAPLARLPQISMPLAQTGELPVGLGLIAAHGNDELLLDAAVALGS